MTNKKTQKNEICDKILSLKKEKNALVLAHYYENLEVQGVADHCGDSFELAKIAIASDKPIIVFCGVSFMAQSAKITNPDKRVFIPRADAGCKMADMVTPEIVLEMKKAHPEAVVVCYINSSAETKAVCDICVTSSNAQKIISRLPNDEIIFVPDKNLGANIAKSFPHKVFHFIEGWCPVHNDLTVCDINKARALYPNAKIAIHPEAKPEVIALCDYIGSTSGILQFCRQSDDNEFVIATEKAIAEKLSQELPQKSFHLLSPCLVCEDMKKTTLEDLLFTLENLNNEVVLSKELIKKAAIPLENMLKYAKD